MELFPFFHQIFKIFKILILFVLYFKNYKRQVVSWNCKHVQHVKIYLPCNFEVNPITHFDRLCKLEKRGDEITKKIFSWETTGPIATKLLWNDPWMAPYQKCVQWSRLPTKMAAKLKIEKRGDEILKKIFSSETTEPTSTKLCWNDHWMVPFQNSVRRCRPVSKMATITKNRNFFKWPKLLYFKPESAQIWTV